MSGRWAVKFSDANSLGDFCLALLEEGQPFTLVGSNTVAISKKPEHILSEGKAALSLLHEVRNAGRVEEYPVRSGGRRRLPTADEARDLLKKFTASRRMRMSVEHR